jgi:hypothetical protein
MDVRKSLLAVSMAGALGFASPAFAHCDTLDGPVVSAARAALESGNVNPALAWTRKADEAEVRHAFEQAKAARKAGGEARNVADRYFQETLVRVHRAGEGAPYTGLKPAGHVEPSVAAADKAIATGSLHDVANLVTKRAQDGLHREFGAVMATRKYDPNDVQAGRAYVDAYVRYVHYVERLHEAAGTAADGHADHAAHGH